MHKLDLSIITKRGTVGVGVTSAKNQAMLKSEQREVKQHALTTHTALQYNRRRQCRRGRMSVCASLTAPHTTMH